MQSRCLQFDMQIRARHGPFGRAWRLSVQRSGCSRLPGCVVRAAAGQGLEAVVLVDHGSKRAEANAMLDKFADLYRASSQRDLVRTAHMELAKPSIADAIAECVGMGASKVIVAPFFLSRGRHITEDIPALVQAAAAQHPDVQCIIAEPLGTDELLAQLIDKRVRAAAAETSEQQ